MEEEEVGLGGREQEMVAWVEEGVDWAEMEASDMVEVALEEGKRVGEGENKGEGVEVEEEVGAPLVLGLPCVPEGVTVRVRERVGGAVVVVEPLGEGQVVGVAEKDTVLQPLAVRTEKGEGVGEMEEVRVPPPTPTPLPSGLSVEEVVVEWVGERETEREGVRVEEGV